MILIPFIGLMAKFPIMATTCGMDVFYGFFPLAIFPSFNASYALVRGLSRKISNVPACQRPVGKWMC